MSKLVFNIKNKHGYATMELFSYIISLDLQILCYAICFLTFISSHSWGEYFFFIVQKVFEALFYAGDTIGTKNRVLLLCMTQNEK